MSAIDDLKETMSRLRGPGGCPWDHEQTHESLCETLIEETAELLEAIDHEDIEHMREELGDVLLQVVFHAQITKEKGQFDFEDVARGINDKLVRRHPHVFGDLQCATSDEVLVHWEKIKAEEKKNKPAQTTRLKGLPPRLPALLFAHDLQKAMGKAAAEAPDFVDGEAIEALAKDLNEVEAGALLYTIAAGCREAGIDPESALRRFCQRVIDDVEDGAS